MGCWNETCGITQLPITYGDKIRAFVLVETHHGQVEGGGTCYINDTWSPIGPPIAGTYDDYGGIENIVQSTNNNLVLQELIEDWVPIAEDADYDPIIPAQEMDLKKALYYVERGYAKAKSPFGEAHLGLMYMLEDVYQSLLQYNPIETQRIGTGSFIYQPFKQNIQEDLKFWYDTKFDKYEEDKKIKPGKDAAFQAEWNLNMRDDNLRMFWDYQDKWLNVCRKALIEHIQKGHDWNSAPAQWTIQTTLECMQISNAMKAARKFWSPQTGKGGQHSELDIYKLINKTSEAIIAKREKESLEDGGEEPDKNGYYSYMLEHNAKELSK